MLHSRESDPDDPAIWQLLEDFPSPSFLVHASEDSKSQLLEVDTVCLSTWVHGLKGNATFMRKKIKQIKNNIAHTVVTQATL